MAFCYNLKLEARFLLKIAKNMLILIRINLFGFGQIIGLPYNS